MLILHEKKILNHPMPEMLVCEFGWMCKICKAKAKVTAFTIQVLGCCCNLISASVVRDNWCSLASHLVLGWAERWRHWANEGKAKKISVNVTESTFVHRMAMQMWCFSPSIIYSYSFQTLEFCLVLFLVIHEKNICHQTVYNYWTMFSSLSSGTWEITPVVDRDDWKVF